MPYKRCPVGTSIVETPSAPKYHIYATALELDRTSIPIHIKTILP